MRKNDELPRNAGAFVQPEIMIRIAIIGIVAAIVIPFITSYLQERKTHQCAERLDAAAADPAADRTCVVTGEAFTVVDGHLCDPSAKDAHLLEEPLCTGDEPLAKKHPAPRAATKIGIPVAVAVILVIVVKVFL